jgi:uncharacterized protein YqjF (DUF2071 family)
MSDWLIQQKWSDLIFISYEVDKDLLNEALPDQLEPDLYEGKAYVSIVPFVMSDIRFFFSPVLPFSKLYELNLRTYVRYKGKKGIFFFTLDSNHRLGNFIARNFFHLPYRYSKLIFLKENDSLKFSSTDSIDLQVKTTTDSLDCRLSKWLTERYSLFTVSGKKVFRGDVIHEPWTLNKCEMIKFSDNFSAQFGFPSDGQGLHLAYSPGLDVRFIPFKRD